MTKSQCSSETRETAKDVRLSQLKPGERGIIAGFNVSKTSPTDKENSYKMKLLSLGLTRGTELSVVKSAPLGDPVEVELRDSRISLRKAEADIVEIAHNCNCCGTAKEEV